MSHGMSNLYETLTINEKDFFNTLHEILNSNTERFTIICTSEKYTRKFIKLWINTTEFIYKKCTNEEEMKPNNILAQNIYFRGELIETRNYNNGAIDDIDGRPGILKFEKNLRKEFYFNNGINQKFDGPAIRFINEKGEPIKEVYKINNTIMSKTKFESIIKNVKNGKLEKYHQIFIKNNDDLEMYKEIGMYFNNKKIMEICKMYEVINGLGGV